MSRYTTKQVKAGSGTKLEIFYTEESKTGERTKVISKSIKGG